MAEIPETNQPDFHGICDSRSRRWQHDTGPGADREELVLGRRSDEFFAIGAYCARYGSPLIEGLIVGDTDDSRNEDSGS
jgi:nitrite reductase/ring-hydroxylating ferredoxin subunit